MASEHHSVSEILALIGSQWGKLQDGTSFGQIARLIELATQRAKDQEQELAQARALMERFTAYQYNEVDMDSTTGLWQDVFASWLKGDQERADSLVAFLAQQKE